ncbi:MAG: GspH/FimT family pseudopilin [Candidatus Omnitrophota bacterium]
MNKRGFTTIEILFVIIVIGILAAVAIPRLGVPFAVKMKVKTAARRLTADLRLTRRYAITNNENYKLSVNAAGKEYRVYDSTDTQVGVTRTVDTSITISANKNFIFEPLGNASALSDTGISLSAVANQWNITVTAATGMVKMVEV